MDELKPCPFCGCTDLEPIKLGGVWMVHCQNYDCSADGPLDLGKSGAIEKWNERGQPDPEQP